MNTADRYVPDWLDVSRETLAALVELEALVLKWTTTVNLISKTSALDIWGRHMLDSAQIAKLVTAKGSDWADLGSGGGFPGLVLAVIGREIWPQRRFTLVESDARKAAFLAQANKTLGLNVTILVQRVEALSPLSAHSVTARALAPLEVLLGFAHRHLRTGGKAYFPKGATYRQEVEAARIKWQFEEIAHVSRTDPQSAILEVKNIDPR